MKKFLKKSLGIFGVLILIIGLLSIFSPTSIKIHLEGEYDTSADEVWSVLAHQFGEISEWSPNIETSRKLSFNEVPSGFTVAPSAPVAGRVTPSPLGGDLTEVLVNYSEDDKMFKFRVHGLPPMIAHSENSTKVTELDNGKSFVTMDIKMIFVRPFNVFAPLMQKRLQTSGFGPAGIIKDLKPYLESKKVSQSQLKK